MVLAIYMSLCFFLIISESHLTTRTYRVLKQAFKRGTLLKAFNTHMAGKRIHVYNSH